VNPAALLEKPVREKRGRRVPSYRMKSMECVKNLDYSTEESFGVWGAVCIESKLWNWGDPTLHSDSCKVDVYKPVDEITI
jgi:hypothetical protein